MNGEPAYDDPLELESPVREAYSLSEAAVMLDQARNHDSNLASALEHNMELWVAITIMVSRGSSNLTPEVKENLSRLGQFITDTTLRHGVDIAPETLNTLININLQISEGLLEGSQI